MHVREVIIPGKAHFDVIVAYWILLKYGEDKFPGLRQSKINFWHNPEPPTKDEQNLWLMNGKLGIDVGGGLFDHHEKADSAVELVVKELGIGDNPELQVLLEYVRQDEQAGLHNRFGEIPAVVKALHAQKKDIQEIISHVFTAVEALQFREETFHIHAKKEFETKAKIYKLKYRGRTVKIATIESDEPQAARFGRLQGFALVIQRRSSGHIMISSNKAARITMEPIIGAIRLAEMHKKSLDTSRISDQTLTKEGSIPQVPHWYYHPGLASIFNGTDAMAKTRATEFSLDEILNIIVSVISDAKIAELIK